MLDTLALLNVTELKKYPDLVIRVFGFRGISSSQHEVIFD